MACQGALLLLLHQRVRRCDPLQDSSTKAVIETPPSETWQIKFQPQSDALIIATAGGSSSKVVLWDVVDTQPRGTLGIPSVSSILSYRLGPPNSCPQQHRLHCAVPAHAWVSSSLLRAPWEHGSKAGADWPHSIGPRPQLPPQSQVLSSHFRSLLSRSNSLLSKRTGTLLQADEKHKREKFVLSVAFSPDGKRLACGVMDGTVAVFDVPSGHLMHTLTGHHKPVRDVCFTPGQQGPQHQQHNAHSAAAFVSYCR